MMARAFFFSIILPHILSLIAFEYTIIKDSYVCTAYTRVQADLPYHVCNMDALCANYTSMRPFLFDAFSCQYIQLGANENVTLVENVGKGLEVMLRDPKSYTLILGSLIFNVLIFVGFLLYKAYNARKKTISKNVWYKNSNGEYVQRSFFDINQGEELAEDDIVKLSRQLRGDQDEADDIRV